MPIEDEKRKFKESGQRRKSPAQSAQPTSESQSGRAENASGAVLGSSKDTLITGGQFTAAASVHNVTILGCTITTQGAMPQTQTENGHPPQTTNRSRKRRRGRMRPQQDCTEHVWTSNEVYERHLREKGRGHPLWIPQPNMVLPKPYRAQGVRAGDVGIFTDDGGFDFLFNICVPIGDPINPEELPENFVPIYPSLNSRNDICKFPRFSPGSYLTSSSVAESRTAEQTSGLTFESSASEGAILTMPEGADSEDLRNRLRFQTYIGTHAKDWYKFANGPCGREARNGDLRLVVGHDKSTSWGMASFSNSSLSQGTKFRLKFTALEDQPSQRSAVNNYAWEYSGVAEVRVGPGPSENKVLGETDSCRLQNQCLFIRSLHVMLSEKVWREVQTVVVGDQNDLHSGIQDQSMPCPPGSSTGAGYYAPPQSSQSHSPEISRSRNSAAASSAHSNLTNYPNYVILDLVPPNQMESRAEDLHNYDIVDGNVALASQLDDEEDTSSQISSDTSTFSSSEEIQCDRTPTPDVIVTQSSSSNRNLHPSQIINQYLLEQVPHAIAAVTHDSDWSGMIGMDPFSSHLDSSQLLSAVLSWNDVVIDNDTGLVFLERKEKDQNGMLSEEVKVAVLVKSIKDGKFSLDQYLFGFHSDHCLRLQELCNALRSGSTNQSTSMPSSLIGHPERPLSLEEVLKICNEDFHVQGRQSITSLRAELTLLPSQHADQSNCLLRLSDALSRRFYQWAQLDDLEEAISSYEVLLSLIPDSHYQYLEALLGLCSSLYQRFYILGHADDLQNLLRYLNLQCDVLNQQGLLLAPVQAQLGKLSRVSESTQEAEPSVDIDDQSDHFDGINGGLRHEDDDGSLIHSIFQGLYRRFERLIDPKPCHLHAAEYNLETVTPQTQPENCHSPQTNSGEALKLRPPPHPSRSDSLNSLGNKLFALFKQKSQETDLDKAIALYRQALDLRLPPHPNRSDSLNNLANALLAQFQLKSQEADLDEAIALYRQALDLRLPPHPNRSDSLNNLANALSAQFQLKGWEIHLYEVISLHRQALALRLPPHPNRSDSLNDLANALLTQFQLKGWQTYLDEAISLHRQALALRLPPHPNRSDSLNNLANALLAQFKLKSQETDLDKAIALYRQALDLRLPPHPNRSDSLNNLANALLAQFRQKGRQTHLDEAISLHRQALKLRLPPHPSRSDSFNNLANALSTRFEQKGQQTDLDEAISLHRQALELRLPPHPSRSNSLSNLANTLWDRFEQKGRQTDLAEAISLHRQALKLRLPPHPEQSDSLNNLGVALLTLFKQKGQSTDLDEAIYLHRQTLKLRALSHPNRSDSLNNLASALSTRFEQKGQQTDLDDAISLHRQALELRLPPHPSRSDSLNNLANALSTRFEQKGQQTDLDEAISLYRQTLEFQPSSHPNLKRSDVLANFANALRTRSHWKGLHEGQHINIDEAISLHRQTLDPLPLLHPHRAGALDNLGYSLLMRFREGHQETDLDEAISLHRQALELQPPLRPNRTLSLIHLGNALSTRFEEGGRLESDLDEALSLYRTATQCRSQPPSDLFNFARKWIHYADRNEHISAINAYNTALQVLSQVAALGFDVQFRQEALAADTDGLARDASRCAIRAGNLEKAVEFLEAGRSIFWTQILSLRSPLDQLHDIEPELAYKMQGIAIDLELGSHRDVAVENLNNQQKLSIDQEVSRLDRLSEEWAKCIEQVRTLKGFEDFMRPARFSSLQSAASKHPVVILVANHDGSHCLIMTSTSVHHISLPNLHIRMLKALVLLVQAAVYRFQISRSIIELLGEEGAIRSFKLESSDDIFKHVLGRLWDELVKPVIKILDIKKFTKSGEMPILQWCPTGHFTFLPIHAAGNYDARDMECAADYFISSYTPTVGALLAHPPVPSGSAHAFKMMVVTHTKDRYSTEKELENIKRHVPSDALVAFGVPGTAANVETVASGLPEASIVHFACYGKQDRLKPLNSGFELDDGLLQISRIMKETPLNGSLAFLSVCEPEMGDGNLPDEAMNLGASLLFSGFHTIITTMWAMADKDGPAIADSFYEELFCSSDGKPRSEPDTTKPSFELDTTKSAQALHVAVQKLRSQDASFSRWIPFIHIGK